MKHLILLLIAFFGLANANAQELVTIINKTGTGSNPGQLTAFGNQLFFVAADTSTGSELWISDGTTSGTALVKDIYPGDSSANISELSIFQNLAWFLARDTTGNMEIWRSDGTGIGTVVATDFANSDLAGLRELTPLDTLLYFTAFENGERKIFATNGASTYTIFELLPDSGIDANVHELTVVGDKLWFLATDNTHGEELWKYDPATQAATLISDVNPGTQGSFIQHLTPWINGQVIFSAHHPSYNRSLWISDGTSSGTKYITDYELTYTPGSGSDPYLINEITPVGNHFYFRAIGKLNSRGFYYSDGTKAGTVKVYSDDVSLVTPYNGKVFFTTGFNIYTSDGTPTGTHWIKINPNTNLSPFARSFTVYKNKVYFQAQQEEVGFELLVSNGTESGTSVLKNISLSWTDSRPDFFTEVNGILYFAATTVEEGRELWRTDGTVAGTYMVKDINAEVTTGADEIQELTAVGNQLFFSAASPVIDRELYVSDGTESGTRLVENIGPYLGNPFGDLPSTPHNLTDLNGQLLFVADNFGEGEELWKSDGTAANTNMVKDLWDGLIGASPEQFTILNGKLYFAADVDKTGKEVYVSDGTAAGTHVVKEIWPTSYSADIKNLAAVYDHLYFSATDGTLGEELYISDGTASGTKLLKDINNASLSSQPGKFVGMGGKVFFTAYDNQHGNELWITDNTEAGTQRVADIAPNSSSSSPYFLVATDTLVFFGADVFNFGRELFISDGTELGTQVIDIAKDAASSFPSQLFRFGNRVIFSANRLGITGTELWISDGTDTGTKMVKNINPGASSSNPSGFCRAGKKIYFMANDGTHGLELWETDGTQAGTKMVFDLEPGLAGSKPANLTFFGNSLFFTAAAAGATQSLWRYQDTCGMFTATLTSSKTNPVLCPGGSLELTATVNYDSIGSINWYKDGQFIVSDSLHITVNQGGVYKAEVTADGFTCAAISDGVKVVQADTPEVIITNVDTTRFCQGGEVELKASNTGFAQYNWFRDGSPYQQAGLKSIMARHSGNFNLKIVDKNGCAGISNSINVQVLDTPKPVITETNQVLKVNIINASSYFWYKDNQIIPGATSDSFAVTQPGRYFAKVISANGCSGFSNSLNVQITGISEYRAFNFEISPNPVIDRLHIQFDTEDQCRLSVFNAQGKLMYESKIESSEVQINTVSWPDGIYLLVCKTTLGTYTVKVVKE